jgi:hypothetical protein
MKIYTDPILLQATPHFCTFQFVAINNISMMTLQICRVGQLFNTTNLL